MCFRVTRWLFICDNKVLFSHKLINCRYPELDQKTSCPFTSQLCSKYAVFIKKTKCFFCDSYLILMQRKKHIAQGKFCPVKFANALYKVLQHTLVLYSYLYYYIPFTKSETPENYYITRISQLNQIVEFDFVQSSLASVQLQIVIIPTSD